MTQREKVELTQTVFGEAFRWLQAYQAGQAAVEGPDKALAEAEADAFEASIRTAAMVYGFAKLEKLPEAQARTQALDAAQRVCDARGRAFWASQGAEPAAFDFWMLFDKYIAGDLGDYDEADELDLLFATIAAYQAADPVGPGTESPPTP